jgi:hypothetical protein
MREDCKRHKEKWEGVVVTNKFGTFRVKEYKGYGKVLVEFEGTGYEVWTTIQLVERGAIKDPYHPFVYGVGYHGEGKYISKKEGTTTTTKVYKCWNRMLERCYSKSWLSKPKNANYKGCTVHPDWHNLQCFGEWFDKNYIEGYELDKDIKVDGNKVYGPDTCAFVSKEDNIEKAFAKTYHVVNPLGEDVEIYNMTKFCKCPDNQVEPSSMFKLVKGKIKSYKGWTLPKKEMIDGDS